MQPFKRLLFAGLLTLLAAFPLASAFAQNEVTFQVDMRVVMYHEFFQPQNGDLIVLRSSVDGWAEDNARVMSDPEGDSVYALTMNLPEGPIEYKFFKTPRADISLEGNVDPGNPPDGNRRYTVVAGSQTLPVASFNNFDEYSDLVSVNVTFQVEMGPYIALGMFNPATDQVGLPSLFPEPLTPSGTVYSRTVRMAGGTTSQYRFKISTAGAPGSGWEAWVGPEDQYGNRSATFGMVDETLPPVYFNNYNPNHGLTTETEPNGHAGLSNTIVLGESLTGVTSAVDDVDYYVTFAEAGDTIRVRSTVDPSSYRMLLFNRDSSYSSVASPPEGITAVVPASDVYYVRYSSLTNGPYTITLEKFTPGAPIIHRLTIDDVTFNSARFTLTIDPNGLPTTYEIEWGQDLSYGNVFVPASNTMEGIGPRTALTEKLRNIPASLLWPTVSWPQMLLEGPSRRGKAFLSLSSRHCGLFRKRRHNRWSVIHRAQWCCRERSESLSGGRGGSDLQDHRRWINLDGQEFCGNSFG